MVTKVDLDLDVCRIRATGEVRVLDEDEFAEHRLRYGYPAEVLAEAERAAAWLRGELDGGGVPFATEYRRWLAMVHGTP